MDAKKKAYRKPRITREKLEEELIKASQELMEANGRLAAEEKERREFLSNLSHDLRAPLSALAGSVELLQAKKHMEQEEYHRILRMMERRIETIRVMIEDMFLLSNVENSSNKLEKERVNAGIFLEEYFYGQVSGRFADRILELELPEVFPYMIEVDTFQMLRVLDNLFSNAVRYSRKGDKIVMGGSYRPESGEVWITVRDTGLGIASQDLEHIFERGYRATRSRTPGDGGSGLGLAIAKGIVERHGGRIWCESAEGEGSCFTAAIPGVFDCQSPGCPIMDT